MSSFRIRPVAVVLGCCLFFGGIGSAQSDELGEIDFPSSGSPNAQPDFLRGVLLIHSFEYDDAAEAFRAAQEKDPDFSLAYWGEALTHFHPLWQEEDVAAAQEVLSRLGATPEERRKKTPTERERGFLNCVEVLFGEGPRREQHRAYADALGRLSEKFPDDLEVAAFHAIAILGTTFGVREPRTYMRAAAVAERVYERNPNHPGALHYLIHSYDDPVHAPLGLRQARRYAKVAPAAAHALHMPSHIYVALGYWEESAASNEDSSAAADARRKRKKLSLDARGYHSLFWLMYTYIQQGRIQAAKVLLDQMQKDAAEAETKRTRYHLAAMRAAFVVGVEDFGPPAEIEVPLDELGLHVAAGDRFVVGAALIAKGKLSEASLVLKDLEKRIAELDAADIPDGAVGCCLPGTKSYTYTDPPGRTAARIMRTQLEALFLRARGEQEKALDLLAEAAVMEDGLGFDFGPPVVVKPAHELLGEILIELGRASEAKTEFEKALARAPRRSLSLRGFLRAATVSGDLEAASEAREDLRRVWRHADSAYAPARDLEANAD